MTNNNYDMHVTIESRGGSNYHIAETTGYLAYGLHWLITKGIPELAGFVGTLVVLQMLGLLF